MATPDISVVIPTFNRFATLLRTLDGLRAQSLPAARYEIIVVDDGSSDETPSLASRSDIRFMRMPRNGGPAAARNAGVRAARGKLILFLGDDTAGGTRLLEQHLRAHVEEPDDRVAVLGHARWDPACEITPLMRYLTDGESVFRQFEFDRIADPHDVEPGFFYTCNISISREFLLQHGLFDEDFRAAYGEDTDLAYRLIAHGLRIVYRPDIVVDHDHPTPYRSVRRRAETAGRVAVLMARKHPERLDVTFLRSSWTTSLAIRVKRAFLIVLADPLLHVADCRRWDHRLLARAFDLALRQHQFHGLVREHRLQSHRQS